MTETILLNTQQIRTKCHIGEGSRCCRYLTASSKGMECGFFDNAVRNYVDMCLLITGTMTAKAGPCANPHDQTSEAQEWKPKS